MLYKDCRNRLVSKILALVESGHSLGAMQKCEDLLKTEKVLYERIEP
jgi:hypothetical protein